MAGKHHQKNVKIGKKQIRHFNGKILQYQVRGGNSTEILFYCLRNEDTRKNREELNRNKEHQVPTINVLPELSLNSRNINLTIEDRQGSVSNDDCDAMFTQTQKPKLDIS